MPFKLIIKSNSVEVAKNIGKKSQSLINHLAIAIKKSAFLVERYSKQFAPVLTGRLRGSISADIHPTIATVEPHVDYAIFVHEGTKFMTARPFMQQGLREAQAEILNVFRAEITQALN